MMTLKEFKRQYNYPGILNNNTFDWDLYFDNLEEAEIISSRFTKNRDKDESVATYLYTAATFISLCVGWFWLESFLKGVILYLVSKVIVCIAIRIANYIYCFRYPYILYKRKAKADEALEAKKAEEKRLKAEAEAARKAEEARIEAERPRTYREITESFFEAFKTFHSTQDVAESLESAKNALLRLYDVNPNSDRLRKFCSSYLPEILNMIRMNEDNLSAKDIWNTYEEKINNGLKAFTDAVEEAIVNEANLQSMTIDASLDVLDQLIEGDTNRIKNMRGGQN